MDYQYVKWIHDSADYPVHLYSEIDQNRMETRSIEIWGNGTVGWADSESSINGTILALEPLPPLDIINQDDEFDGRPISKDDFEKQWDSIKTK